MKYAGVLNVIDDQGEIVYERELSQEAIITELLTATPKRIEADDKPIVEPEVLTRSHVRPPVAEAAAKVPQHNFVKHVPDKKKGQKVCKACGEPGHMQKTCPTKREPAEADVSVTAEPGSHEILNFSPLSNKNFEILKDMQVDGSTKEQLAAEFNHDADDIEVAMNSKNYLAYTFDRKKMIAKKLRK